MTYIFMAVHCPAEGKLDEVYASMRQLADSATGTPGLIEIGPEQRGVKGTESPCRRGRSRN